MCVDPSEEAFLSMKGDPRADAGGAAERNVAVMRVKSARSGASAASSAATGGGSSAGRSASPVRSVGGVSQASGAVPASNSVHWDRSRISEELGRLDPHGMLLRVPDAGVLPLSYLCSSHSYSCNLHTSICTIYEYVHIEERARLSCSVAATISRTLCNAVRDAEQSEQKALTYNTLKYRRSRSHELEREVHALRVWKLICHFLSLEVNSTVLHTC